MINLEADNTSIGLTLTESRSEVAVVTGINKSGKCGYQLPYDCLWCHVKLRKHPKKVKTNL